ncbi:hypothetical protein M9H77_15886 [Catharanthus roseus]|uniref:Uncharacterized protein n=1 Tax=Catharanthus roseus TaxID=4058 RepID=A0ACC0B0S1_CATRO|nr:hypothetical protein M9H77_15886 [Catharanthus roseus]
MSILGGRRGNNNMGSPFFHEFKKQASFFLKEKIKTARLVLTDVTPAQLLAEDSTSGNPGAPETRTLKIISRAAFEIDDYWRVVEILHKRLVSFDRKNWWVSYKALIVLEHLLTHGPESFAEEFQSDKDVITEIGRFQYVDEKGFNWGLTVRRKSEKILKLLGDRSLLKEERNRARTVTRGIQGFGSFHHVSTNDSGQEVLKESSFRAFDKCNSQFHEHGNQEEEGFSALKKPYFAESKQGKTEQIKNEMESLISRTSFKENMAPKWDSTEESNLLLSEEKKSNSRLSISMADEEHPFNSTEHIASVSLLSTTDRILQAC